MLPLNYEVTFLSLQEATVRSVKGDENKYRIIKTNALHLGKRLWIFTEHEFNYDEMGLNRQENELIGRGINSFTLYYIHTKMDEAIFLRIA